MRIKSALILLFLVIFGLGCAQHPMVFNIENEPVPASVSGERYSLDDVTESILSACRKKGWSANAVEPGIIIASITIRTRHRAKIEIRFTPEEYSIRYLESSGLEYSDGRIHGRYNHWIARLDAEIKKGLGLTTQRY